MIDTRIILSALWVALMFLYQQGDVQRLYSGDFVPGELDLGNMMSAQTMWMIAAITHAIPTVMIFLSLILKFPVIRWSNIIIAILFILYTLAGLLGKQYPSSYDNFLLIISLVVNGLTVWYAWNWTV